MLTIFVKHYLTLIGIEYFQNEWWGLVQSIIQKQEGFISLSYSKCPKVVDCIDLILKFQDEVTFKLWASLETHEELIRALNLYRSRNYFEACLTLKEHPSIHELEWITYIV
jgi:hypothetical protein